MNRKQYSRLLFQLLLLPLLALSLLAIGLVYSLQIVQQKAAWVDHSDQVIAQVNSIVKLIVDQETSIRGYSLTHDPAFLDPYARAQTMLPQAFDVAASMVRDNPQQTARLEQIHRSYRAWHAFAVKDIQLPDPNFADLRLRKQQMDGIRAQANDFLAVEAGLRSQRFGAASTMGRRTRRSLMGLILLIAILIAWLTQRIFSRCLHSFRLQLDEAELQGKLAAERGESLNTTLRSIGDGVIACDPEGRVALMNRVAEELTGWTEQEAAGRPLPDVFHIIAEHTRIASENPVDKVRRTGTVVGLANHTILIRKDGSECGIDDSASPIFGSDGKIAGIVLVFRDCTERRNSQLALMRAEKLAAAGKLAASIAHEVNNPLEGLTNMLYLADQSHDLAEVHSWLAQAQSEVDRLSHITRRTLGFYRESTQPASYLPGDIVEEVLAFYVPEALSKKIQFEAQIRTQQEIYGIPGELRQVLSNLISNSIDAMPNGGTIRLAARTVTDLKDSARSGVRITVADNGSGIPPHLLEHIFEPFFTTKLDTGTGLGLWVSKELIEKQGGRLRVRSCAAGARTGTLFSIFVPANLLSDPD